MWLDMQTDVCVFENRQLGGLYVGDYCTQKSVAFLYTDNNLSKRKEKNPIYNCIKRNKTYRNNFNQGGGKPIYWKLQDINERNWRRHK